MKLRPATEGDARTLFEWANDPDTRANSAMSDPIPWEDHAAWFASRLASPGARIWIGEDDEAGAAGVVRFERRGPAWEISVNVAPAQRGRGAGSALIAAGCDALGAEHPGDRIVAFIREANAASRRAFERSGFALIGEEIVRGARMLRYERTVREP